MKRIETVRGMGLCARESGLSCKRLPFRSIRSIRFIRISNLLEPARAAVAVPGKGRAIQGVNKLGYGLNGLNG
jgi:hypothetical protein